MKLLVILVILWQSFATPLPSVVSTTTARYSLGGLSHLTQLSQFSNNTKIIPVQRFSKTPKNEKFYTEMVLHMLTQPRFRSYNVRKIKQNEQKLLKNFVRTNFLDLNTPNTTRKPSKIIINIAKPVYVSNFKKPVNVTEVSKVPFKIRLTSQKKSTVKPNTKPTIRRVITKWSETANLNELKQTWFEQGVPYPTPNPEINSYSPPVSINEMSSTNPSTDLSNAISTFNLAMVPSSNTKNGNTGSPCPSVQISSSVLNPQNRQECSELNLVINSHFHQNVATDRSPAVAQTYDAVNVPAAQQAEPPPAPAPAADTPAAAAGAPGGVGGTGGAGGGGGNGGNGGGNNGLNFPDFKGLFDIIRYFIDKFGHLLKFLLNPYLYIVPIILFFVLGFLGVILLFPWWLPALFLFASAKTSSKKSNVVHVNHVHKPIHHSDGWFWNHETKTWQNVADFHYHRRVDQGLVTKAIENLTKKYGSGSSSTESWKWRRKNW